MKTTRLIVNADDLGMSRGITDGILIAHKHGFLTSASLMANMPAAEYAIERLSTAPRLGVGAHLNICQARPLLPACEVRSLVDSSGFFHAPGEMRRRLWRWQVSGRELEWEFREQIRWLKHRGIQVTHADSHHHMHIYPAAVLPFARALASEGIHRARASRCGDWRGDPVIGGPHGGGAARRLLVQSYRHFLQSIVLRGIASPDRRVIFMPRENGDSARLGDAWKASLECLPQGIFEMVCHPGLPEAGFSETDRIQAQRQAELRWLMDRDLRSIIERTGIQLITYDELSDERVQRSLMAEPAAP